MYCSLITWPCYALFPQAFLVSQDVPEPTIQRVVGIIQKIGFKEELPATASSNASTSAAAVAGAAAGAAAAIGTTAVAAIPLEAAVVQDADRYVLAFCASRVEAVGVTVSAV